MVRHKGKNRFLIGNLKIKNKPVNSLPFFLMLIRYSCKGDGAAVSKTTRGREIASGMVRYNGKNLIIEDLHIVNTNKTDKMLLLF